MIPAADTLVKNDHKRTAFHTTFFYGQSSPHLDELHLCYLERKEEKLQISARLSDSMIQQTKIMPHSIISLFISTMCSSENKARDKSMKQK